MGLVDPVFRMAEMDLLRALFDGVTGSCATLEVDALPQTGPIKMVPPDAQEFRTPSGRLEIFSQTLADEGIAPLPDWHPDLEETRDGTRWPLRLLTAPGFFQAHTTYDAIAFLRQREGPPFCVLNPSDAAERSLAEGQTVHLFNDRAAVRLALRISDEIQPGVVLVPGQRTDPDDTAGTVNMLCSDRLTDMGAGATYQSTFLDVTGLAKSLP
jgi:anaerobic selenocysteine-containing dehydrogenase